MRLTTLMIIFMVIFTSFSASTAQFLSGAATVNLSGPITQGQSDEARKAAGEKFKLELVDWFDKNAGLSFDTSNALDNYGLETFLDSCVKHCKEESSFKGKTWTVSYSMLAEETQNILKSYNIAYDSMALDAWTKLQSALQDSNPGLTLCEGIKAMAFANAHLGPPLSTPGNESVNLTDAAKNILQEFLKKLSVSSSGMIIQGRTGQPMQNPPTLIVTAAGKPLENVGFTGFLPNGREFFSKVTDADGKLILNDLRIPFVANGTILSVNLNLGHFLCCKQFLDIKAFGLQPKNSINQEFMFKIIKQTYTLKYDAHSAGKINIPADFSSSSYIQKFLKDSCFLEPAQSGFPPDMEISINFQVSSYNYDETEETGIKVATQITIKGLSHDPPKTEKDESVFEKRYDRSLDVPYGLFFWEAGGKTRESIKSILLRM